MKPYQIPINGTWIDLESIVSISKLQYDEGWLSHFFLVKMRFCNESLRVECYSPVSRYLGYEHLTDYYEQNIYKPLLTEWQKLGG